MVRFIRRCIQVRRIDQRTESCWFWVITYNKLLLCFLWSLNIIEYRDGAKRICSLYYNIHVQHKDIAHLYYIFASLEQIVTK